MPYREELLMIPFFVRRYNDIDHVAPIVYRMAKDKVPNLAMFCLDPGLAFLADRRIMFLRDKWGVRAEHLCSLRSPHIPQRALAWTLGKLRASGGQLAKSAFVAITKSHLWRAAFGMKWAMSFIQKHKPAIMVFDWHKPKLRTVKVLIAAAKSAGLPVIGVPHGGHITIGKSFKVNAEQTVTPQAFGDHWRDFDQLAIQDPNFANLVVSCGVDREKVEVLGSARFCREWVPILDKLHSAVQGPEAIPGRLNVLYLDHDARNRIHTDVLVEGLSRVANLPFVELLVKPSTLGVGRFAVRENTGLSSAALPLLASVEPDMPTLTLVKWADVVMGTTTSALIEAPVQGKAVIMPTHFHANSTLFEKLGACWSVSSNDELVAALESLHSDPDNKTYGKAEEEHFLNEMVYAGEEGKDVLGAYSEYLLAVARKHE